MIKGHGNVRKRTKKSIGGLTHNKKVYRDEVRASKRCTFFMSNCDILVEADYDKILEYHRKMDNIITMVCAGKKFQVPYGTVQVDEAGQIVGLQEKPELSYRVNTGLYLIEPRFLDKIPDGEFIHITDIIEKCLHEKERVGAFLIEDDDWMDMGQMDELESMRKKMGFQ